NFYGEKLHNTVYVTTNPFAEKIPDGTFHSINFLLDEWDRSLGTVPPQRVVNTGIEAHNQFPNKRIIVHFIQPHAPFLGPTAEKIKSEFNIKGYDIHLERDNEDQRTGVSWQSLVRDGKITKDEFCKAYQETLEITLKQVSDLVDGLDGKSVLTADHGEMLFERVTPLTRREAHHPYNTHTEQLCIVPWHEPPYDNRRVIKSEAPLDRDEVHDAVVNDRLEALGYKDDV
ncbi:hypothetical protein, partial [Halobacterium salinarum]|uniref:hypothetical protein n=1 Tax=Halobacterium salinarum TaxID=2242 RepID=UPI0025538743